MAAIGVQADMLCNIGLNAKLQPVLGLDTGLDGVKTSSTACKCMIPLIKT